MSKQARVQFVGFSLVETRDTATHEVEFGTITDGEHVFAVEMLRNKAYQNKDFLLSKIFFGDKEVWSFRTRPLKGIGLLKTTTEGPALVDLGVGKTGKVAAVIPLRFYAGRRYNIDESIALKREIAEPLRRDVFFTPLEEMVLRKASREAGEATRVAFESDKEAKAEERQKRVFAIMARGKQTAYTEAGVARTGYPVVGDEEWRCLSHGVYVIVYASIGEDGRPNNPIEAFQITRERGKGASKKGAATVFAKAPTRLSSALPKTDERKIAVQIDGDAFEVILFDSMDAIREARAKGLNGGTYVSVDKKNDKGKFQILAVHHDDIETIGEALPIE